jgi:UPF0716 protein FxsA
MVPVLRYLLIGILALPFVEIATFIKVGALIGLMPTLAAIAATSLIGALVLRQQGLSLAGRIQNALRDGALPGRTLFDAMTVFMAGTLLVLPGFVTDAIGLVLLLPPVRGWLYERLSRNVTVVSAGHPAPERPRVIELDSDDYREN